MSERDNDTEPTALPEELTPERRVRLYLGIARKLRRIPDAQGVRHAAVQQAWDARKEGSSQSGRSFLQELVIPESFGPED